MNLAGLRRLLLSWYAEHRRAMPWRAPPGELADPYAVLVSETMLQQTQVATVTGYFQRFMERFPTVYALAAADEQAVLAMWQGLGYYRRARSLHRAARTIVDNYGGELPRAVDALLELPGVGRYTAGAIASIAFGVAAPVVDGNVSRVLARLAGDTRPSDDPAKIKQQWETMGQLVRIRHGRSHGSGPGDLNQAVMELGATVCLPRGPRCESCPVCQLCAAKASGDPERFGGKAKRARQVEVAHRIVAVARGGRWLFEQRGGGGLWGRMWQLPTWDSASGESRAEVRRAVHQRLGLRVRDLQRVGDFIHITTHRRIRFEVLSARASPGQAKPSAGVWRRLNQLNDLPLSNAQKRAIELLQR